MGNCHNVVEITLMHVCAMYVSASGNAHYIPYKLYCVIISNYDIL